MASNAQKLMISYAQGFGAGHVPFAPGTFGSIQGVILALALHWSVSGLSLFTSTKIILTTLILVLLTWLTYQSIAIYEATTGRHDDQKVVADEIIGQAIAMSTLPIGFATISPRIIIMAGISFLVFRLLDIKKPWLIGEIDRNWPGASGTLGDDIVAGVATGLVTYGVNFIPFIANLPETW